MKVLIKTMSIVMVFLMILGITAMAYAEPVEIIKSEEDGEHRIEKIYVLSEGKGKNELPTEGFTEDGVEYVFTEVKVSDNSMSDRKEYSHTVTVNTTTSNTKKVMEEFEPEMVITTEDGYVGILEFDYTTLEIEPSGYKKQDYTITESRSYPNLMDADTSLVPKTITKDGVTLNLTNIDWQSAANDIVDGYDLTVRYTANATYSGTGTKTYATGYIASATYSGIVAREGSTDKTYTVIYDEVIHNAENVSWIYFVIFIAIVLCMGAGYLIYRVIRKRKKGY